MRDRFVHEFFADKSVAKVVMNESATEIVMGLRVVGPDVERCLKMRDCFVQFASLQKNKSEIVVGDIVVCGDGKRMSPKRFAVFPMRGLNPCAPSQSGNHHCCRAT